MMRLASETSFAGSMLALKNFVVERRTRGAEHNVQLCHHENVVNVAIVA